jgi:hypothetical protein
MSSILRWFLYFLMAVSTSKPGTTPVGDVVTRATCNFVLVVYGKDFKIKGSQ